MRMKSGDTIKIFNEIDGEFIARIIDANKREVSLIIDKLYTAAIPTAKLTLFFAPTKNVDTSYIIQKATELGVTAIIPVITQRTIVKKINLEKLQIVAKEAAEQCERFDIPSITEPIKLSKIWDTQRISGTLFFCDERGGSPLLKTMANTDDALLIGPEGGFSSEEKELIYSKPNSHGITLGNRILRADTATIAALAIYQSLKI